MQIHRIDTGFIDVPHNISMNIFTQGCTVGCKNCSNKSLQNFSGGTNLDFDQLLKLISTRSMCKWVCWLGGNPTEQPDLYKYCKFIKKHSKLKICVYTGHYFNSLAKRLLESIDLVIDGPFIGEAVNEKKGSNQKIYMKINKKWTLIDNWHKLSKKLERKG